MSNIVKIFLIIIIFGTNCVFPQSETNIKFLEKYSLRKEKLSIDKRKKIDEFVQRKNIPRNIIYNDKSIGVIEEIVNNKPIYNKPLGLPSIKGMRVDSLWIDGGMKIELNGDGYNKIGLWESYHPYNHTEYNERIIVGDGGSSNYEFTHSTATAGIIIATGINNNAIGVAKNAKLKVFSTVNRLGEMAAEASNGMELASYSYETRQYYSGTEADIDTISYAGPNFLLFQACGNDGSDTPQMVMGQQKNSITIGAARVTNPPHSASSEIIRKNSSMGPTIDGRIKPDIVAPFYGDALCNQKEISGYTEFASPATSWSTASAAGVGLLMQEFYQQTHGGDILNSSSLKALLIHSAFEAGLQGPDYEFGWGMINAKKAINLIYFDNYYSDVLDDVILQNNGLFSKEIYSDGSKPIKVTICWIDPPAAASSSSDSSPKLINDLDLRISKDGIDYFPWVLDQNNPFNPATTGDNSLDNVEQVLIEFPEAGIYTIEVSHKNNLSNDGILTDGTQLFSILITGESHCSSGSIILNDDTKKFNFCKDGYWIEKY